MGDVDDGADSGGLVRAEVQGVGFRVSDCVGGRGGCGAVGEVGGGGVFVDAG